MEYFRINTYSQQPFLMILHCISLEEKTNKNSLIWIYCNEQFTRHSKNAINLFDTVNVMKCIDSAAFIFNNRYKFLICRPCPWKFDKLFPLIFRVQSRNERIVKTFNLPWSNLSSEYYKYMSNWNCNWFSWVSFKNSTIFITILNLVDLRKAQSSSMLLS